MKVLVTGGAGFIGSHVVEWFQKRSDMVIVLDNLRSGSLDNLSGLRHTFVNASVEDRDVVRSVLADVDYVFHLAALVSVAESMERVHDCLAINAGGTITLLEEAARAGVRKFVMASSAAVYGNHPAERKSESLAPEPLSPYAITKLDGEYYCRMFTAAGKLDTVAFRFFNVFGARQDPSGPYSAVVPAFIRNALNGSPLIIHGDGRQTRDFVYVKDIVGALVFGARNADACGVYNVGYGEALAIRDLAEAIVALTGSSSEIRFADVRAGDVRHSLACPERLRSAGWQPQFSFKQGLKSTIAAFAAGDETKLLDGNERFGS